jgi:hypothetical protein
MLTFFVTAEGRFGIDAYGQDRGAAIAERMRVVTYDTIGAVSDIPVTGTIFAAVDQIGPAMRDVACQIADRLAAADPDARILNRPDRVLRRYELLTKLSATGVNRFRVRRAAEGVSNLRFPVFVRSERRHSGSLTPLLGDGDAVRRALAGLLVTGRPLSDLLIVEFCDTSGVDGLFRKYSALRVGDAIIPRHLHAGTHWVVKSEGRSMAEALVREEIEYVTGDPHGRWLRQVFDLAAIDYGRIDYGLWRGEPQVWEINTNPTFGAGHRRSGGDARERYAPLRRESREAINRRLLEAFAALERPEPIAHLRLALPRSLRDRLVEEHRARARAERRAQRRRALTGSRGADVVKRALRPVLTAVAAIRLRAQSGRVK